MSAANPAIVSSSFASRVPPKVLRGHVIMGAIQITVGCLLIVLNIYGLLAGDLSVSVRNFSGFWTALIFIPAGATGVAGGKGGSNTQCCIISCLVLSILAACMGFSVIFTNSVFAAASMSGSMYSACYLRLWCFTAADILWFLLYTLELVVAIVQAVFACRASCCCLPDAGGYRELTAFPGPGVPSVSVTVQQSHVSAPPQPPAGFPAPQQQQQQQPQFPAYSQPPEYSPHFAAGPKV